MTFHFFVSILPIIGPQSLPFIIFIIPPDFPFPIFIEGYIFAAIFLFSRKKPPKKLYIPSQFPKVIVPKNKNTEDT